MKKNALVLTVLVCMYTLLMLSCKKEEIQSSKLSTSVSNDAQSDQMVITPYGKVPASRVREVDNKTIAKVIKGRLQLVNITTGKLVKDIGALSKEDITNSISNPYAYAAKWNGNLTQNKSSNTELQNPAVATGTNYPGYTAIDETINNIQSFSTTWVVPKKPLDTVNIVTTFLWNGLNLGTLQPVLQWDQGQGPNYTITNWYFVNGNYFHGVYVPVQVGTQLTGVITFVSHVDSNWTYKESFVGYPDADVTVVRNSEATGVIECWEAYTQLMSQWPNQPFVAMNNIKLTTRTGTPPSTINWNVSGGKISTPSGNNTVIVNNSSSNGEVDFYFGDGTGISPDSSYKIVSAVNGTSVLDVTNGYTVNGTPVQLYTSNGTAAQKWKLVSLNNGYYKLLPGNAPTRAMDVANAGTVNGTQVQIYDDNGTNAQKWKIAPAGNGYYTLSPACAPSSSLDVNGGGTANGTKVQIYATNNTNAEKFKFVTP